MAYTRQQKHIARTIIAVGKRRGESRKEILSALATALTEANLENPRGGDGSSVGWRQETSPYGSVSKRRNVKGAANRYYNETSAAGDGRGMSVGQLSQTVQRSAFPDRYATRVGQAEDILGAYNGGRLGGGSRSRQASPGVDNSDLRKQLLLSYLQNDDDPNALLQLGVGLQGAKDQPATYAREKRTYRHKGGETNIIALGKLAQSMGLHVGENIAFGGVSPVHTEGSWHYERANLKRKASAAIDVSGDPRTMARFAAIVSRRYGRDLEEEIYRGPGSKDRFNIKGGKQVGRGFYTAHEDHVHVADDD